MTYHLNPELRKIISLVVIRDGKQEWQFRNGEELIAYSFQQPYTVDSIRSVDAHIEIGISVNVSPEGDGTFF